MRYTVPQINRKIQALDKKIKKLRQEIETKFIMIDELEENMDNLKKQKLTIKAKH